MRHQERFAVERYIQRHGRGGRRLALATRYRCGDAPSYTRPCMAESLKAKRCVPPAVDCASSSRAAYCGTAIGIKLYDSRLGVFVISAQTESLHRQIERSARLLDAIRFYSGNKAGIAERRQHGFGRFWKILRLQAIAYALIILSNEREPEEQHRRR